MKKRLRKKIAKINREMLYTSFQQVVRIYELSDLMDKIDNYFYFGTLDGVEVKLCDFRFEYQKRGIIVKDKIMRKNMDNINGFFNYEIDIIEINTMSNGLKYWFEGVYPNLHLTYVIDLFLHEYAHRIHNIINNMTSNHPDVHNLKNISIERYTEFIEESIYHDDRFKFIFMRIRKIYQEHLDDLEIEYSEVTIRFTDKVIRETLILDDEY